MKRALTPSNIRTKNRKLYELEDKWLRGFGKLERGSVLLVFGDPGNGKTSLVFQLADYLKKFDKVAYNSLEMGDSLALDMTLKNAGITDNLIIYDRESIEEIVERMSKNKSPNILIIDSIQYFRNNEGTLMNLKMWIDFKKEMKNKTLIIISHAKSGRPKGALAESIFYDADCKVLTKGFRAYITSRYGGGDEITIWEQGAKDYHGEF